MNLFVGLIVREREFCLPRVKNCAAAMTAARNDAEENETTMKVEHRKKRVIVPTDQFCVKLMILRCETRLQSPARREMLRRE